MNIPTMPMGAPQMGGGANMMESLKSNLMTMMMFKTMNGTPGEKGDKGGNDMIMMVYMFVVTQVIDFIMKKIPIVGEYAYKLYLQKFENIKQMSIASVKDIVDNTVKTKTASITVTIGTTDQENVVGQALLDFITNHRAATHISYKDKNFVLNQTDVIIIDEDVFAIKSGESDTKSSTPDSSKPTQIIEIYSFTKTMDELRAYLDQLKTDYVVAQKNKIGNSRYFFNLHPCAAPTRVDGTKDYSKLNSVFHFTMKRFQTNRKFSNLFGEEIDVIRKRVNFFIKNKKWYDQKGIPYTLGLLLSGNPGTGKTSTIKCLTNETNRHIINVNLNNDITKQQFENLFYNENIQVLNMTTQRTESYCIPFDQRIYVLEDIDCQDDIVKRRDTPEEAKIKEQEKARAQANQQPKLPEPYTTYKLDLSFLLNLLDGVLETPGRILVMTSNVPDALDRALVRPGRIDISAKFQNCSHKTMTEMIEFFYDTTLSVVQCDLIQSLNQGVVTPAEMGKIMFENMTNIQSTLDELLSQCNVIPPLTICDENNIIGEVDIDTDTDMVISSSDPDNITKVDPYITPETVQSKHDLLLPETPDERPEYIRLESLLKTGTPLTTCDMEDLAKYNQAQRAAKVDPDWATLPPRLTYNGLTRPYSPKYQAEYERLDILLRNSGTKTDQYNEDVAKYNAQQDSAKNEDMDRIQQLEEQHKSSYKPLKIHLQKLPDSVITDDTTVSQNPVTPIHHKADPEYEYKSPITTTNQGTPQWSIKMKDEYKSPTTTTNQGTPQWSIEMKDDFTPYDGISAGGSNYNAAE